MCSRSHGALKRPNNKRDLLGEGTGSDSGSEVYKGVEQGEGTVGIQAH